MSELNRRSCHFHPASAGYKYRPPRKSVMADLTVKSAVKEHLTDQNVSSDFYDALDNEVADLLDNAARRAEDNDRKTVQARDL